MDDNDLIITESELLIPALQIIKDNPGISTTGLIKELANEMVLSEKDKEILNNRSDTHFSQKVRNLCRSHRTTNSFEKYVDVSNDGSSSCYIINTAGLEKLNGYEEEQVENLIEDEKEQIKINSSVGYDNDNDLANANNREPELTNSTSKKYKTDAKISKTVLKKSNYICNVATMIHEEHNTFSTKKGEKYVEGHHLIPMSAQKDFKKNIDRSENIVSLCPICHRCVHYGSKKEREAKLKILYDSRIKFLNDVGIYIAFEDLMNKYY
jgi:5-methylcytosine-specific restriction protein A